MRIPAIPLLTLAALAACATRRESPPPEPAPPPAQQPPPAPVIIGEPVTHPLRACVVQNGELTEVVFQYNHLTGDSTYQDVPFSRAFPLDGGYAQPAQWFADGEVIRFRPGPWFVKYGLPRRIDSRDLARVGEYRGVGVYAEAGQEEPLDVIYLPVRPGCIFQTYVVVAKLE